MKPLRNALALMTIVLAGCSTSPWQYISPRVEGRVLDNQTSQPMARVRVHRVVPDMGVTAYQPLHGGEVRQQTPFVHSRRDGTFVLQSQRDLALLRGLGWYSINIAFEHRGYESFTATYTLSNATNTTKGEPIVLTGDILLKPLTK